MIFHFRRCPRSALPKRSAVEARVKRALSKDGQLLRRCSSRSRWFHNLGDYYIVDERNCIVATDVDLEQLAHEFRLLASDRAIVDD
jgi:hypothetical protein